ncbi:MAG: CooT family nickel-binding protein [Desulfotignum sp.]|nr:CooT family nickel-binding protein [Desulfotignum sp.]
MCEASAYMIQDGKETLILESVDIVEPLDDGGFMLRNIFGDQAIINARIHEMELVNHRILFPMKKQAARYLDMECLAMIAMVLAEQLAGKTNPDMAMLA